MHVVATAGHVDHGKSALVRALTGMEPDRWAEERRRGMTIDLGFAWTDIAGEPVAFVDVPGHERFVPNMLAGVGPVPAVLFVVAADEGWMPQSAEHLAAIDALGVRHGLLAITRSDLADPARARAEALAAISATSLGEVPAVAVSSYTGEGIQTLRESLARLVGALPPPDPGAPVRLWVDRSFSISGAGTVVTGTLGAGTLRVGQALLLEPGSQPVRVRGLQTAGEPQQEVRGVSRVAVNLRGVDHEGLRRGAALVEPHAWASTELVDVRLRYSEGVTDDELPAHAVLHLGSAALTVRIRALGARVARLQFDRPLPLHVLDAGLLRDPARRRVLAGVRVLDVRPPALQRRGAASARARELARAGERADVRAEIARRGVIHRSDLVAMGYRPPAGEIAGGWYVDPDALRRLATQLSAVFAAWVSEHPLDPRLPVEAARQRLGLPSAALVDVVRLEAGLRSSDGRITSEQPAALPAPVRRAVDELLDDFAKAPFAAPEAARLAALGLTSGALAAAVRAEALLRLADGVVLGPRADEAALDVLARLPQPFTLSEARQALQTTRRVAVPLMEMLDRRGLTRRLPDDRRVLSGTGVAGSLGSVRQEAV